MYLSKCTWLPQDWGRETEVNDGRKAVMYLRAEGKCVEPVKVIQWELQEHDNHLSSTLNTKQHLSNQNISRSSQQASCESNIKGNWQRLQGDRWGCDQRLLKSLRKIKRKTTRPSFHTIRCAACITVYILSSAPRLHVYSVSLYKYMRCCFQGNNSMEHWPPEI